MSKPAPCMILLSLTMITMTMISRYHHILASILCLESMMLPMIYYLPSNLNNCSMNMSPATIILLTVSVSSTSIGLTLLVMISRKEGSDSTTNYSLSMC